MKSTRFYFTLKNIPLPYLQIKRRCVGLLLLLLLPVMASAQVNFEDLGTTLEQALAKAKAENKLIFVWLFDQDHHFQEKLATFLDPKVAEFMNPHFVSISVKRKSSYGAELVEKRIISGKGDYFILNANGQEITTDFNDILENTDLFIQNVSLQISRHVYCNSPSEEGFQLVKTSFIDGVKCEHYEKDGLKVRTFIKDNGDFITIKEDEYGVNRIPQYIEPYIFCSEGKCDYPTRFYFPLKFTTKSGIVCTGEKVEGNNGFKFRTTFPVGNYIESTNKISYQPKNWQIFKSGDVTITKFSGDSLHIDKLNKNYPIVHLKLNALSQLGGTNDCFGIDVNDRFCELFPDGSISKSFMQKFDGHYYFANKTDTIVDVIYDKSKEKKTLKYVNGDEVIIYVDGDEDSFNGQVIISSHIHRNGGILRRDVLELPDGRVYEGSFLNRYGKASRSLTSPISNAPEANILSFDTLTYWYGTMTLPPDGRIVEYSHGQTEEEIKREAEKKRKQEEAEEKAAYNQLCTKFGKKYVDAALAGKPIVGMPEQLFVAFFKPELSQEYANSRCYHVRGWSLRNGSSSMTLTNKALKYSVWVTNGKISSISTW